jgi:hypothetical protein
VPYRQQKHPKQDQMHNRVIHIHHEKIPPVGGHCDDVKACSTQLRAVARDQSNRSYDSQHEDSPEGQQTHAGIEESDARERENLVRQLMVNQSTDIGEIRHDEGAVKQQGQQRLSERGIRQPEGRRAVR